jgi:hypothetical protein
MGKINWGRVILGGLLAGVVINIVEYVVNGRMLSADWAAAMSALGRPAFSGGAAALFIVVGFLVGIGMVWLYAAIRPRYGPGPRTAICAGLGAWFLAVLVNMIGVYPLHLWPTRLLAIGTVVSFFEYAVAGLAGGWVYKES